MEKIILSHKNNFILDLDSEYTVINFNDKNSFLEKMYTEGKLTVELYMESYMSSDDTFSLINEKFYCTFSYRPDYRLDLMSMLYRVGLSFKDKKDLANYKIIF